MTRLGSARWSWARESVVFAGRLITGWRRNPAVTVQAILFPTALLVFYHMLAGKSMVAITGTHNLESLVPMCAMAGGMFGAIGAGIGLMLERRDGLLGRFWTLPVRRASAITGRVLAEGVRNLIGAVIITAVGVALGLRFHGNLLAALVFLLLPVLVAVTFSMLVMTMALKSGGNAVFMYLGSASTGLAFCSPAIAPVDAFPSWLQPFVQYQPLAPAIESMRALAAGEPAVGSLVIAVAWIVVLAALFGPLAVRQYRISAEAVR